MLVKFVLEPVRRHSLYIQNLPFHYAVHDTKCIIWNAFCNKSANVIE